MLKKFFRVIITIIGAIIGYGMYHLAMFLMGIYYPKTIASLSTLQWLLINVAFIVVFSLLFFLLAPTFNRQSKKAAKNIEVELQSVSGHDLIAGTIGLIFGLVIAFLISPIYELLKIPFVTSILTVLTYLTLGYVGIFVATHRASDLIQNQIAKKPGQGFLKDKRKTDATPKILDTSVIIDGRIVEIMKTGFIEGHR